MTISMKPNHQFQKYEQFDPLELIGRGEIQLFHEECAGGKVRMSEGKKMYGEQPVQFSCEACEACGNVERKSAVRILRGVLTGATDRSHHGYMDYGNAVTMLFVLVGIPRDGRTS